MLEDSTLSVSQIARSVDFDSASYFGQVFQKHLAISPSSYRKDLNNNNYNCSPLSRFGFRG